MSWTLRLQSINKLCIFITAIDENPKILKQFNDRKYKKFLK